MKTLIRFILLWLTLTTASLAAEKPIDFLEHLGIQLWSLNTQMKQDVPSALDLLKNYGLKEVETAGTGNLTTEQFAAELKSRGLVTVGTHVSYELLVKELPRYIADAKTLGAKFVICPYPPKGKNGFDAVQAKKVAAEFNAFGEACRAAGLRFGFHPHGLEFQPIAAGATETPFDILVRETNPELVCFEMDVFWVFHAGQDPAKLLEKYPTRWALMHVKDIRKGAVTGLATGRAAPTDNVPVGDGQIDWPAVLRTAGKIGVEHYFIEDETPAPLQSIPVSLRYLSALKL